MISGSWDLGILGSWDDGILGSWDVGMLGSLDVGMLGSCDLGQVLGQVDIFAGASPSGHFRRCNWSTGNDLDT